MVCTTTHEVVKLLGKGAYGRALLCRETAGDRLVVVKEVRLTVAQCAVAQREAGILASLDHPNVTAFFGSTVETDGLEETLCISMEYCDGGDLEAAIVRQRAEGGLFDEARVMRVLVQLALALKYVHSRKILHRDVKPQNIFLTTDSLVKLGDFGVAKCLSKTGSMARTQTGTPYYLSPEIFNDEEYNDSSDIWSLGVVLYELATLKLPFQAGSLGKLAVRVLKSEAPVPQNCSSELQDLLAKLLCKRPGHRPSAKRLLRTPFVSEHARELMRHNPPGGILFSEEAVVAPPSEEAEPPPRVLDDEENAAIIQRWWRRKKQPEVVIALAALFEQPVQAAEAAALSIQRSWRRLKPLSANLRTPMRPRPPKSKVVAQLAAAAAKGAAKRALSEGRRRMQRAQTARDRGELGLVLEQRSSLVLVRRRRKKEKTTLFSVRDRIDAAAQKGALKRRQSEEKAAAMQRTLEAQYGLSRSKSVPERTARNISDDSDEEQVRPRRKQFLSVIQSETTDEEAGSPPPPPDDESSSGESDVTISAFGPAARAILAVQEAREMHFERTPSPPHSPPPPLNDTPPPPCSFDDYDEDHVVCHDQPESSEEEEEEAVVPNDDDDVRTDPALGSHNDDDEQQPESSEEEEDRPAIVPTDDDVRTDSDTLELESSNHAPQPESSSSSSSDEDHPAVVPNDDVHTDSDTPALGSPNHHAPQPESSDDHPLAVPNDDNDDVLPDVKTPALGSHNNLDDDGPS